MKTLSLTRSSSFDEVGFLQNVLGTAPSAEAPLSMAGVRSAIRLLDELEKAPQEPVVDISFEDSDFAHLTSRLDQIRWLRVDRQAVALVDRIKALA